jgi:sugar fermentation stimulation protein A
VNTPGKGFGEFMKFPSLLTQAVLIKRTKRFLADVVINNQEYRTIYCPNPGAMTGCDLLGSRIWFSHSTLPKRKHPDTWELVEVDAGFLVCVNSQLSYALVVDAIENGVIQPLQGYTNVSVSPVSLDNFTFEMMLEENTTNEKCFVEVRSVTLGDEIHRGFYPDAKSPRAVRQLKALIHAKRQGHRAVFIFCVQHTGIARLFPADHIDMQFGATLRQAVFAGVEILAYGADISLQEISLVKPIELCIPARMICSSR